MRSFLVNAGTIVASASFAAFGTLSSLSLAGYKPAQDFLLNTAVKMGAATQIGVEMDRKHSLMGVEGWTVATALFLPAMVGLTFAGVKAYSGARSYFFPKVDNSAETQRLVDPTQQERSELTV